MNTVSTRTLVLLAASGLLFGCASVKQSDLDAVRVIAERAAADAAAANQAAAAAQARADAAMSTASGAKAQSDATEAKIDRMFKKAMYK
ncbi:MAG: hypothetical protein LJE59_04205 [Chromatiaceae bacterium]|jgi:murein lipoprotein|nr:hypothetical protein [Chromatiaceae bacterium]